MDERSKLKRLTLEGGAAVQALLQVAFQDAVEVEAAVAFQDAVEVEAAVVAPIHLRLQVHFAHLCFKRNISGGYTFLWQKQVTTKSSGKQTVKPAFVHTMACVVITIYGTYIFSLSLCFYAFDCIE